MLGFVTKAATWIQILKVTMLRPPMVDGLVNYSRRLSFGQKLQLGRQRKTYARTIFQ